MGADWVQPAGREKFCNKIKYVLAGGRGVEPRFTESESVVLPLNDPPMEWRAMSNAKGHMSIRAQVRIENESQALQGLY